MAFRPISQSRSLLTSRGNRKVATLGDSRTDQDRFSDATNRNWMAEGYMAWLRFLTRQRFDHRFEDNYGVAGDTTAQMLARVPAILAATDASLIIIFGGTNDRGTANMTLAESIANMTAIRDLCLSAGRSVLFVAEMLRGDSTYTSSRLSGTQLARHMAFHTWLLQQQQVPGCFVADVWPATASPGSANGDLITGVTRDGLHPNKLGAYYLAQALAPQINAIFPPVSLLPASNSEVYSADNLTGDLVVNPMMQGTAGSYSAPTGGSASGSLADSWTNQVGSANGMTLTYSKITRASDGKPMQRVVVGGTPSVAAATADLIRQTPNAANLAIGDVVEGLCDIDIAAGQSGCLGVSLRLFDATSNFTCADLAPNLAYTTDFMPNVALSGVLRTPRFTLTSTNIRFMLATRGVNGTPISQTIDAALTLHKVS